MSNTDAIALSRHDKDVSMVPALSTPALALFDDFHRESLLEIANTKELIAQGKATTAWTIVDSLLLHEGRILVPTLSALWPKLLATAHSMGHKGVWKILHRLCASLFNPHTARMVRDFIKGSFYQRNKTEHRNSAGPLQPLEVPSMVSADIAVDSHEGFSQTSGKSVVHTVVDRVPKYAQFIALGHLYTAVSVTRAFFDGIIRLHGMPCSIINNKGSGLQQHILDGPFQSSRCQASAFTRN